MNSIDTILLQPKVYVDVKASFDTFGNIIPTEITWEDGRRYQIEKVKAVRHAAAMRSGGQSDKYTIMIRGKESYLYFERNTDHSVWNLGRWFVERKQLL